MPAITRDPVPEAALPPSEPQPDRQRETSLEKYRKRESVYADRAFRSLAIACAVAVLAIVGLIFFELVTQSRLSLHKFGISFLARSVWDPVTEEFGALPFIYGTLVSSLVALVLAVPPAGWRTAGSLHSIGQEHPELTLGRVQVRQQ